MAEDVLELRRLERRDTDIELTYEDGTTFTVSYDDLRHACPCAKCAPLRNEDETSMQLRRTVEAHPKQKPLVRTVGNYALSFEWESGCSSGIYRLNAFGILHTVATLTVADLTFMVHGDSTVTGRNQVQVS